MHLFSFSNSINSGDNGSFFLSDLKVLSDVESFYNIYFIYTFSLSEHQYDGININHGLYLFPYSFGHTLSKYQPNIQYIIVSAINIQ